jgi:hypothetical protein
MDSETAFRIAAVALGGPFIIWLIEVLHVWGSKTKPSLTEDALRENPDRWGADP